MEDNKSKKYVVRDDESIEAKESGVLYKNRESVSDYGKEKSKGKDEIIKNHGDYSKNKIIDNQKFQTENEARQFNFAMNLLEKASKNNAIKKRFKDLNIRMMEISKNFHDDVQIERKDLSQHNPKFTSDFLAKMSSSDNPLKFIIHDKPNGFNLLSMVKEWTKILMENNVNLQQQLWSRIHTFIGNNKQGIKWYFNHVSYEFNLQGQDVKKWCLENPEKHPILKYDKEIEIFKNSIKVYDGALLEICKRVFLEKFGPIYTSINIDWIDLDKAEFYTNVDSLISGLGAIAQSMKRHLKKDDKIRVKFRAQNALQGRLRIIEICHIGSTLKKNLDREIMGGDMMEVENHLFKICDWSIKANEDNGKSYILNLLYNPLKIEKEKSEIEAVDGFTHVLTFYS